MSAEQERMAEIASRYTPINWHQAFADQPAEVRWLVNPIIEEGTVCAIFGAPDSHKSLFVLEQCLLLAREGRTVVYIDQENRRQDLVTRLKAFGASPGELDRLRLYSYPDLPPLDTPQGGLHLKALAVVNRAALVVLDTTGRMVAGRENDADTFLQLYRCSLMPLKGRGITSLRIDHPGKDPAKGQRGSSAKDGDADVIWWMRKLSGTRLRLDRHRDRTGNCPEAVELVFRQQPVSHEIRSAASRTGDLARLLDDAKVPADAPRTVVREALRKHNVTAANDLLSEVRQARLFRSGSSADRDGPADGESWGDGPPESTSIEVDRPPDQAGTSRHEQALRLIKRTLNGEVISDDDEA